MGDTSAGTPTAAVFALGGAMRVLGAPGVGRGTGAGDLAGAGEGEGGARTGVLGPVPAPVPAEGVPGVGVLLATRAAAAATRGCMSRMVVVR